jgi:hypothetical protein
MLIQNRTLANDIKRNTTDIKLDTASIQRDTSQMLRILLELRNGDTNANGPRLQGYIQELETQAESVYEASIHSVEPDERDRIAEEDPEESDPSSLAHDFCGSMLEATFTDIEASSPQAATTDIRPSPTQGSYTVPGVLEPSSDLGQNTLTPYT